MQAPSHCRGPGQPTDHTLSCETGSKGQSKLSHPPCARFSCAERRSSLRASQGDQTQRGARTSARRSWRGWRGAFSRQPGSSQLSFSQLHQMGACPAHSKGWLVSTQVPVITWARAKATSRRTEGENNADTSRESNTSVSRARRSHPAQERPRNGNVRPRRNNCGLMELGILTRGADGDEKQRQMQTEQRRQDTRETG